MFAILHSAIASLAGTTGDMTTMLVFQLQYSVQFDTYTVTPYIPKKGKEVGIQCFGPTSLSKLSILLSI